MKPVAQTVPLRFRPLFTLGKQEVLDSGPCLIGIELSRRAYRRPLLLVYRWPRRWCGGVATVGIWRRTRIICIIRFALMIFMTLQLNAFLGNFAASTVQAGPLVSRRRKKLDSA